MTKKQKAAEVAESCEFLRQALADCGPDGNATLEIRWVGGKPTPYGRTDYYELRVWGMSAVLHPGGKSNDRPIAMQWLTHHAGVALGYRFNKSREALSVGGCGYSKPQQIGEHLAHIAGHPIYTESPGQFAGGGWHAPRGAK
jgi:hypothetical protein